MKKILFLFLMLLCLVSCKEDLTDYYNRIEQREAANAALQRKIDEIIQKNAELANHNEEIRAMLSRA